MPEPEEKNIGKRDHIALPNLLLLAGSGREVGKTLLGCAITSSANPPPVVLKISSHFHPATPLLEIILSEKHLIIGREHDISGEKDSSRYLRAGADSVYYIQCREEAFPVLADWIRHVFPANCPLIAESAALGNYVTPGFAIFIDDGWGKKVPDWRFHREILPPFREINSYDIPVVWRNNRWKKR